jgi:GT2 family glycosyltransferase
MDLSITIVSHNHKEQLQRYLPTLFNVPTHARSEIAIIDNNCTDGSADWVKENFPAVQLICNRHSKSYAENMNMGMHLLNRGRYFVVMNPDISCLSGLWDKAIEFMDSNSDVGIMGPQLLNPDLTVQPSCRRFSTPRNLLIRGLHMDGLLKNYRPIQQYLMHDYDHKNTADVDWVTGALMIVRRDAISHVGGMDERYTIAYSEDQDWCCRMWRGGWRVTYFPQAQAVHDHLRTGMRKPWSKMGCVQLVNAIRMFRKFKWKLSRSAL